MSQHKPAKTDKKRSFFTPTRIVAIIGIFAVIAFSVEASKTPPQTQKSNSDTAYVSAPVSADNEAGGSFWTYLESVIADFLLGKI